MTNEILTGLEYSEQEGALSYKGVRYLLIRPETVMGVFRALAVELPKEAGEIFYMGGFAGGKLSAEKYREVFGLSDREIVEFMMRMGGQLGWGRFELMSLDADKKNLQVAVHNSPYAQGHGPSELPVCHFIRGVLAGLAEGVFGGPVESRETSCLAVNPGPCRFQIGREG